MLESKGSAERAGPALEIVGPASQWTLQQESRFHSSWENWDPCIQERCSHITSVGELVLMAWV